MKIKYGYFSATDDPKKSQEKVKRYFEMNETNTSYTSMCDVMKVIFTHLCRLKGRCIAVFPHRSRRKISSQ